MPFLKHTLDFYLKSSIHVALAVVALSGLNGLFLNKIPDVNLLLFQFSSTIFYYNSLKYGQLLLKGALKQLWFTVALWILTVLSLVVSLYTLTQFSLLQLLMVGTALVLGLSYVFLPSSVFGRENGTFKTLTVALVWAIVTSALNNEEFKGFTSASVVQFIATLCWILALMFPFEFRDRKGDQLRHPTLVQRFGLRTSRFLAQFFLACWVSLTLIMVNFEGCYLVALMSSYTIATQVIAKALRTSSLFYTEFWVEGLPVMVLCICGLTCFIF
jgi:hypothetical protein